VSKGLRIYIATGILVLGLHGCGGWAGWFEPGTSIEALSIKNWNSGSGGGGWSGGGFRGGK